MRLWTIHPRYLDPKGLVALWRESLLAQKVLQGKTKGYRHHPQLIRFKSHRNPESAIAVYLRILFGEAKKRGYRFNAGKIPDKRTKYRINETRGQLLYEWWHLKRKLKRRDHRKYLQIRSVKIPVSHPLFRVVRGKVRGWERIK